MASELSEQLPDVHASRERTGLRVLATQDDLDRYVMALGHKGIAVRELLAEQGPLEALFASLVDQQTQVVPR
jgi:hypothetical protein